MPVLIKRYANRKLYDTESSRYITLKGISELLEQGKEIRVVDKESGDDITSIALSQILVDDQKQSRDPSQPLPGHVLSELVHRGGDAIYDILRRSVDDAHENFTDLRSNVRRWIRPSDGQPRGSGDGPDPSELTRAVHEAVERVIRLADLPTRADIEVLNKNLARLSAALESFERQIDEARDPA